VISVFQRSVSGLLVLLRVHIRDIITHDPINLDLNDLTVPKGGEQCTYDQVRDGNLNCIEKVCGLGYVLQHGKCQKIEPRREVLADYSKFNFGNDFSIRKCFQETKVKLDNNKLLMISG